MSAETLLSDDEFGELMSAALECAQYPSNTANKDVVRLVEEIVRTHMAQAWDEGYQHDWTGGVHLENPYRGVA